MTKDFWADVAELRGLLERVQDMAERVSRHDWEQGQGIESAEMLRTIQMCEMSGDRRVGDLLDWLTYVQHGRAEHRLTYDSSTGRFRAGDRKLTCGSLLELHVDDSEDVDHGWNFGRVEHSDRHGGYYFFNRSGLGDYPLAEGMRVAIR